MAGGNTRVPDYAKVAGKITKNAIKSEDKLRKQFLATVKKVEDERRKEVVADYKGRISATKDKAGKAGKGSVQTLGNAGESGIKAGKFKICLN